tara:strand:+ start:3573 stop:4424 length:852 start_codon:yes stop_codon:yes gene_type:complete
MISDCKNWRKNWTRICVTLIGLLALSGCKTTSERWVLSADRTQNAIEQTLVEDDWTIGVELIRNIPKKAYDDVMPWLKDRAHTFPPVYLYAMADRLYKQDKASAVHWFAAARVRHAYDLYRCSQPGAIHRLDIFTERFDKTVLKYIRKNPEAGREAAFAGLAWDISNPIHRTSPAKECMIAQTDSRHYSPFSGVYYPILNQPGYDRGLVKPAWQHPEMLDKARLTTRRYVEDINYRLAISKSRLKEDDENDEADDMDDFLKKYSVIRWQSRRDYRKPWRLKRR